MIGYKYTKHAQNYWRLQHNSLIPLSMPHSLEPFSEKDQQALFNWKKKRPHFIRWESNFDKKEETEWWHIIKTEEEDISTLSKNTRYEIRRALKFFYVGKCDKNQILSNGYRVYIESFKRYETFEERLSLEDFQRAIEDMPDFTEFWAVFEKESKKMVAFSENIVLNNCCFYNSIWFEPEPMRRSSGYLLFHEMNKYYLNECQFHYVSDGSRSINHKTNVHAFLIQKFKFRKAFADLNIIYSLPVLILVQLSYPLRKLIKIFKVSFFEKLTILLEQERIFRSCKRNI